MVPRDQAAQWRERLIAAGVRPAGVWAYEAHRVAALRPRLGVDTDERTIPHEVGWIGGPGDGAVHLDKGCYRGQETVARVHNLGKPPRMLVLLHLDGSADRPATGDPVLAGGRPVGRLGTVVDHVDLGPIALALLKRGLPADTAADHRRRVGGGRGHRRRLAARDATAVGAGRLAVDRLRGDSAEPRRPTAQAGPASTSQRGTVKCWQDNKHTQIGAACTSGRSVIARGGPPWAAAGLRQSRPRLLESSSTAHRRPISRSSSESCRLATTTPTAVGVMTPMTFADEWVDEDDWRR